MVPRSGHTSLDNFRRSFFFNYQRKNGIQSKVFPCMGRAAYLCGAIVGVEGRQKIGLDRTITR